MFRAAHTLAVFCLAGAGAMGHAAVGLAQGDGSGTDNPDLLRGSYSGGCAAGTLCDFTAIDLFAPSVAPHPYAVPSAPMPIIQPMPPATVAAESAPPPLPALAPTAVHGFEAHSEWAPAYALGLHGAYVRSGEHESFEMVATPRISVSRSAGATRLDLDAHVSLVAPNSSDPRLGAAGISGTIEHRLSPGSALTFDADLSLSQDAPNGLSVEDQNVAIAPVVTSGQVEAAYSQRFGRFDVTAMAGLSNRWTGATTLDDGTVRSNEHESVLGYGGSLRLGYAATPVIGTFIVGEAGREDFLAADPDLSARRSSALYALRGGVTGNWSDVITAEASIGAGWRDYDDPLIADAAAWLYRASLGFAPSEATRLAAVFDTQIGAGSGSSGASSLYRLSLEAGHTINPWLALRANAWAGWELPEDGSAITRTYGAGTGVDFAIGPHSTASLDYDYGRREDADPARPIRDEHRLAAGLTLRY